MDRFCPEWGELLGLGAVSRRPYVSTGLVVARRARSAASVLELVDERQRRGRLRAHVLARATTPSYPLLYADQDLLNAALAARADADELDRASTRGSRRARRSRACGSSTSARFAAPTTTAAEPLRRPPLARQALARADPPRRLLAAAAPAADRRRRRDPGSRAADPAAAATRVRVPTRRARASTPRERCAGTCRAACADALRRASCRERRLLLRRDARYFLGAVGLINSLRLVGHTEPIYLLDCGLTARPARAARPARRARRRPAPTTPPWLLKTHRAARAARARSWC